MPRKKPVVWVCPYNEGVDCSSKKCGRCGWNPDVARERLKEFLKGCKQNGGRKKV